MWISICNTIVVKICIENNIDKIMNVYIEDMKSGAEPAPAPTTLDDPNFAFDEPPPPPTATTATDKSPPLLQPTPATTTTASSKSKGEEQIMDYQSLAISWYKWKL